MPKFTLVMRRHWLLGTALLTSMAACDTTRSVRDSTAALPSIGATIPGFSYPAIRGTFARSDLRYGNTIIALVPANVRGDEPEIVEFDSLTRVYSVRSAIVFPRAFQPHDTAYLNEPSWMSGSARAFAGDSMRVLSVFAPGAALREDGTRGATLHLPSFLVVSDSGKVLARAVGRPFAALTPVLDSIRLVTQRQQDSAGAATVARARPVLQQALAGYDPLTLDWRNDSVVVRISGTCSGEETVERGIVPATMRLVDLEAGNPGVYAIVEIVSVADVTPLGERGVCGGPSSVTFRNATSRYRIPFHWNGLETETGGLPDWYTEGSIDAVNDGPRGVALVPPDSAVGIPASTVARLRAAIDSARGARPR